MSALAYKTQALKEDADRDRQRELLKALCASDLALRLDKCGAWRINGKHGCVYTWSDEGNGWVLRVCCPSTWGWTLTKKRLSFCKATIDGDTDGCLHLRELPTPEQAAVIRAVLGIRKRLPSHVGGNLLPQKVLEPAV